MKEPFKKIFELKMLKNANSVDRTQDLQITTTEVQSLQSGALPSELNPQINSL